MHLGQPYPAFAKQGQAPVESGWTLVSYHSHMRHVPDVDVVLYWFG